MKSLLNPQNFKELGPINYFGFIYLVFESGISKRRFPFYLAFAYF